MRSYPLTYVLVAAVLFAVSGIIMNCHAGEDVSGDDPFTVRPFMVEKDGRWLGNAICYGPHRDGQQPGGPSPSSAELREDLDLMLPHWNLLRVYAASEFTETLLSIIRDNSLDMHVVLGVWIAPEERRDENGVVLETFPDDAAANDKEVEEAIRLAAAFPKIVSAVCVGNETQIYWSAHRSPMDILIDHVRRVRSGVSVPVTVADDFNFWNKPESRALAAEIDFVMMHAHPMWNGLQLEDALTWLQEQIGVVQKMHPDRSVVLGETGWATSVHTKGEQAELIKGKPGEAEQKFFYEAVRKWADSERFPVFFFEAFDENWKGGPHPAEVEKHWGLFNADRTPKAAMSDAGGE